MRYDNTPPPNYSHQENPNYGAYPNPNYGAYPNPNYGTPVVVAYGSPTGLSVHLIKDYLAWSIINLFCGWGIGGILPLIFSIICRSKKSENDYSGAQSMSTLALIFNILITIGGSLGWLTFIIIMVVFAAAAGSFH